MKNSRSSVTLVRPEVADLRDVSSDVGVREGRPLVVPTADAGDSDILAACSATADELSKTRVLVTELESENRLIADRLQTEKEASGLLSELNETRRSENDALRAAIAAKNETIAAKDVVIKEQDKLAQALRRKTPSPWKRLGDVLTGAAAVFILR